MEMRLKLEASTVARIVEQHLKATTFHDATDVRAVNITGNQEPMPKLNQPNYELHVTLEVTGK